MNGSNVNKPFGLITYGKDVKYLKKRIKLISGIFITKEDEKHP